MNTFSELNILLTSPDNTNLHIFGMSETKLKDHNFTFEPTGKQKIQQHIYTIFILIKKKTFRE